MMPGYTVEWQRDDGTWALSWHDDSAGARDRAHARVVEKRPTRVCAVVTIYAHDGKAGWKPGDLVRKEIERAIDEQRALGMQAGAITPATSPEGT